MKIHTYLYLILLLTFCACGEGETEEQQITEDSSIEEVVVNVEEAPQDSADLFLTDEQEFEESDCEINLSAYISDPDTKGPTNVRTTPNGEVIMQLKREPNGNYEEYFLTIEGAGNGWFKVYDQIDGIDSTYRIPEGIGWIHGSVIGFDTRNYANQELKFYAEANENSEVVATTTKQLHLRLKDVCGDWVKVTGSTKEGEFTGWIQTVWLCGNPLTNCS